MFAVHGLRVIETEKGRFVNMPSTSYTDKGRQQAVQRHLPRHNQVGENCRKIRLQLNAYDLKPQQVQQRFDIEVTDIEETILMEETSRSLKMNLNRS